MYKCQKQNKISSASSNMTFAVFWSCVQQKVLCVSCYLLSTMLARFFAAPKIFTQLPTHRVKNYCQLSFSSSAPPEAHWVNRWGDPNRGRARDKKNRKEIMTTLRFDGRVAIVTGAGGGDDCHGRHD